MIQTDKKKNKINQRDIPIVPIFYTLQDDVILRKYQQKSLSVYGNNNISQDTLNRPIKQNDTGILLISNLNDLALLLTNLRNDIYCNNRDDLRIYRRSLYPTKKNVLCIKQVSTCCSNRWQEDSSVLDFLLDQRKTMTYNSYKYR